MTEVNPLVRINELRQKVIKGEPMTIEEAKEAIQLLRQQRAEKLGTTSKETALPTDLNDLFKEPADGKKKDVG